MHCIVSGFLLKGVKSADTGCDYNANTILVEVLVFFKFCIGYSLVGCVKSVLSIKIELTELLAVSYLLRIESFYLTSKLCLEFRGIKMCNRCGSAYSFNGIFPCSVYIIADGSDGAKTCYYNSL